jgi:hypothetical protein
MAIMYGCCEAICREPIRAIRINCDYGNLIPLISLPDKLLLVQPLYQIFLRFIYILQNFPDDASPQIFAFMIRDRRRPAVGMPKEFMASPLPHLLEPATLQELD